MAFLPNLVSLPSMEYVVIIVLLFVAYGFCSSLMGPKVGQPFICKECGQKAFHGKRTVGARNVAGRYYCKPCHDKWRDRPRGCLGVIVFLILVVSVVAASWLGGAN
jgi:hypothetical protein